MVEISCPRLAHFPQQIVVISAYRQMKWKKKEGKEKGEKQLVKQEKKHWEKQWETFAERMWMHFYNALWTLCLTSDASAGRVNPCVDINIALGCSQDVIIYGSFTYYIVRKLIYSDFG